MKRWTLRILLILLLGAPGVVTTVGVVLPASASSAWGRQANEMRILQMSAHMFYNDTGAFPITNQAGSWYEKLLAGGYIVRVNFNSTVSTPDGLIPADLYGYAVVYEPPDVSISLDALIRCVGPNGIDDGGTLDDWDVGTSPNLGYWYKWNWPILYRRAWLCALGLVVAVPLIAWRVRPWLVATACALLIVGLTAAIIVPFGVDAGFVRTSASHIPRWVDTLAQIGVLVFLAGLAAIGLAAAQARHRRRLLAIGHCPMCKYDLRGDLDRGCPECGWNREP